MSNNEYLDLIRDQLEACATISQMHDIDGNAILAAENDKERAGWEALLAWVEAMQAENQRLRDEIAGFPSLADLRQAMIDTADENAQLRAWKESAISVTPPLQEIATELGVSLGEPIHDKILPGIVSLKTALQMQSALKPFREENHNG